jgi:hypothetical protein
MTKEREYLRVRGGHRREDAEEDKVKGGQSERRTE